MERRVQQGRRDILLDIADVKPARSGDLAFAGLHAAAMQRSSVVFPRPLAATSPIRSPGLTTRFSRENSGVPSVTPRLRIVISVMIVLWSCRPPRFRWHAAIIGRRCQSAAIDKMRSRTQKRATHDQKGRPEKTFREECLVSPANAFAGRGPGHAGDNAGKMSSCAALLSRLKCPVKIACPATEDKPMACNFRFRSRE